MTMYCGKCGTKRDTRSKYCISCGQEFKTPFKEKEKEEEAKKPAKLKNPLLRVTSKWMRALIVAAGVAGVVLAVLVVFWLAGSFHKEEVGGEAAPPDTSSPLSLVDQARSMADSGDLDGAIKHLEDVSKANPQEGVYYWYLADFYREKGKLQTAIRVLEKCYESYKDDGFWGPEVLKKKEEFRREALEQTEKEKAK